MCRGNQRRNLLWLIWEVMLEIMWTEEKERRSPERVLRAHLALVNDLKKGCPKSNGDSKETAVESLAISCERAMSRVSGSLSGDCLSNQAHGKMKRRTHLTGTQWEIKDWKNLCNLLLVKEKIKQVMAVKSKFLSTFEVSTVWAAIMHPFPVLLWHCDQVLACSRETTSAKVVVYFPCSFSNCVDINHKAARNVIPCHV